MTDLGNDSASSRQVNHRAAPASAAIFGASGGIGDALVRRLEQLGTTQIYAGSRSGEGYQSSNVTPFRFDLEDEASIRNAADMMRDAPPEWVVVASGVLTLDDGTGPERSYRRLDPDVMAKVFSINAIGPAVIAKHMLGLMPRTRPFTFAAMSARVGSIGDNGLGGWHSYRASKAALNMLLKNFAIEMGRTHEQGVVAGLHPGTVDTALSEPFQKGLPEGQLTDAMQAADNLIAVLASLTPEQSGQVFDFAGKVIEP
ncbi:SDR family NAD(P)-dependent oxidoreductase [Erythrobacter sp. SCSIO 43205]|uniref:SDR family NAD(P)-dependent oxidoreductase n=1 Tax=Erythrobacter sp. SCSIO 43205 TaxID=2779361 RepID=UPI001CA9EF3F|nr:SDR family NAD(P)-dependent oxidoreductase [Erythrobacter sp. SCSIO 43205]UAB77261.1 SDR family NAD(P)-dependent oxidoreductase [Erythrobacter sp. SCSIO 43205]